MRKTGYTTKDLNFISTGLCPNCQECADSFDYDDINQFNQDYESGLICDEGSFSWQPCNECNTNLGGDSFYAHGVDSNNDIVHFKVCYNCFYEINGYTICENCESVCADYGTFCYECNHENKKD